MEEGRWDRREWRWLVPFFSWNDMSQQNIRKGGEEVGNETG